MQTVTVREPLASRGMEESRGPAPSRAVRTLDDLAALTADEARALYETARAPRLTGVRGDLRGRMLALEGTRGGWVARALRAFARLRLFP